MHIRNPDDSSDFTISPRIEQNEMMTLLDQLDSVSLNEGPDESFMRFGPTKHFSVKSCYQAMNWGGVICLGNSEISTCPWQQISV
jgi:hypothetical protein